MWIDSNYKLYTGDIKKDGDCINSYISSNRIIIEGEGITLTEKLNKKKKRKKITVFISG